MQVVWDSRWKGKKHDVSKIKLSEYLIDYLDPLTSNKYWFLDSLLPQTNCLDCHKNKLAMLP